VDKWTILFDLDGTLVMTHNLEKLREEAIEKSGWGDVYNAFDRTFLLPKTSLINRLKSGSGSSSPSKRASYDVGVVTSSPRPYAEKLLSYHGLDIPVLSAYHDTRNHKPSPDSIINAMEKLRAEPSKTIYVGDTEDDVQASLLAGCIPFLFDPDSSYLGTPYTESLVREGGKLVADWKDFLGYLGEIQDKFADQSFTLTTSDFFSEYGLQNLKKSKDLEEEGYDVFFHDIYYPPKDRDGISERDKYISELIYSRKTYDNLKKDYQKPAKRLLPEIESWLNSAISLLLIPVPSRDPQKIGTGESMITDLLCDRNPNFLSGTNYLKRVEEVPRHSYYKTHLKTIRFDAPKTAYNVVILDNVVSTGGTMKACIDRVKGAGAKSVIGLAVAETRI